MCQTGEPVDVNICFTGEETDFERLRILFMVTQLKSGIPRIEIQKPVFVHLKHYRATPLS